MAKNKKSQQNIVARWQNLTREQRGNAKEYISLNDLDGMIDYLASINFLNRANLDDLIAAQNLFDCLWAYNELMGDYDAF